MLRVSLDGRLCGFSLSRWFSLRWDPLRFFSKTSSLRVVSWTSTAVWSHCHLECLTGAKCLSLNPLVDFLNWLFNKLMDLLRFGQIYMISGLYIVCSSFFFVMVSKKLGRNWLNRVTGCLLNLMRYLRQNCYRRWDPGISKSGMLFINFLNLRIWIHSWVHSYEAIADRCCSMGHGLNPIVEQITPVLRTRVFFHALLTWVDTRWRVLFVLSVITFARHC